LGRGTKKESSFSEEKEAKRLSDYAELDGHGLHTQNWNEAAHRVGCQQ
jgi:hypothetical protein